MTAETPPDADTVGPAETIAALRRATAVPIVAEVPQLPLRVPRTFSAGHADAQLKAASSGLHYYWIRRPSSLALERRYVSPAESPDVELAELRASLADLKRLVAPLTTGWNVATETLDHNQFFDGLSPQQKTAMRGEQGLPYRQLSPEQQGLWNRINLANAFGQERLGVGRVHKMLSGWSRAELAYLERPTLYSDGRREIVTGLWFRYPDSSERDGWARESMPPPVESPPVAQAPTVEPAGSEMPKRAPLSAVFNKRVEGQDGETTLGELSDLLSRALNQRIEVPSYARGRRIITATSGTRASEVVTALEDLYGWTIQKADRGYRIDRPALPTPTDLVTLHAELRAAVPPAMKLLWAEEDAHGLIGARANWQRSLVYLAVRKQKGPNWTQAKMSELDEQTQRRMANYLFGGEVRSSRTADPRLAQYLVTPTTGYFRLKGSEDRPFISYNAPRPDGNIDVWGWAVKSSSRYRR